MKILVTGGTGMVGSVFNNIKTDHELILVSSKDCDLKNSLETNRMIKTIKPQAVIHLAARVGGIKGNRDHMGDFFSDNMAINLNLLDACHNNNIEKVVSVLSTCIYPNNSFYPLTEDQIHMGPPHESNFGYAYAKRMLDIHSKALRRQYERNYTCAIPNNLYGPNDNFDLLNGHVVPTVIRKIWEAKQSGTPPIFWGTGRPLREFTYAPDFAETLLWMVENYNSADPLNVGNTEEIEVSALVASVSKILDYGGEIIWDIKMPEGQFKKPSSNENFLNLYKNFNYTKIKDGLELTCNWFIKNYPNVRGVK